MFGSRDLPTLKWKFALNLHCSLYLRFAIECALSIALLISSQRQIHCKFNANFHFKVSLENQTFANPLIMNI